MKRTIINYKYFNLKDYHQLKRLSSIINTSTQKTIKNKDMKKRKIQEIDSTIWLQFFQNSSESTKSLLLNEILQNLSFQHLQQLSALLPSLLKVDIIAKYFFFSFQTSNRSRFTCIFILGCEIHLQSSSSFQTLESIGRG